MQTPRNAINPGVDRGIVCAVNIPQHIDDAARVDDIVGRIDDPAIKQQPGDVGTGQLVVRRAADELCLHAGHNFAVERAAERAGREDVGLDRRDLGHIDDLGAVHRFQPVAAHGTHIGDHQPRALREPRDDRVDQGCVGAAADEHRIGIRQRGKGCEAIAMVQRECGLKPVGFCILADVLCACGMLFNGMGRATIQAPFHRDRPRPCAEIP